MILIQVWLFLDKLEIFSKKKLYDGYHKCYSEMADIRQFIRSELSIIKKEVIESTRSMIRNEIRSISFDSNLWIIFLVLIYGPSPRYNLLVTIYQWFTFCTMSNCSLSSTFFHFISTLGAHHFTLVPTVGTVPSVDMIWSLLVLICFFFSGRLRVFSGELFPS